MVADDAHDVCGIRALIAMAKQRSEWKPGSVAERRCAESDRIHGMCYILDTRIVCERRMCTTCKVEYSLGVERTGGCRCRTDRATLISLSGLPPGPAPNLKHQGMAVGLKTHRNDRCRSLWRRSGCTEQHAQVHGSGSAGSVTVSTAYAGNFKCIFKKSTAGEAAPVGYGELVLRIHESIQPSYRETNK